jgi:hypothetical protein
MTRLRGFARPRQVAEGDLPVARHEAGETAAEVYQQESR